uniref:DM domain-containing protein n=1 Tax=Electrophorus electricus TaxID=8005 RepID=A0A4W4FFV6_ELEEL
MFLPHHNTSKRNVARSPKCARCRNHGFIVQLKGHSGKCQFMSCKCWKCSLISERTKIMATQTETVSEINTPVPRSEVDGKTYTDLEVPTTSSWRANDPERRPEQIEDLARQSTRYNDSKGGTEDAVCRGRN